VPLEACEEVDAPRHEHIEENLLANEVSKGLNFLVDVTQEFLTEIHCCYFKSRWMNNNRSFRKRFKLQPTRQSKNRMYDLMIATYCRRLTTITIDAAWSAENCARARA
jgi:hypothetical protein